MCILDSNMRDQPSKVDNPPSLTTAVIRPIVQSVAKENDNLEDLKKPCNNVLGSSTECLGCFHDVCVPFAPSHLCQRSPGEPPPPILDREVVSLMIFIMLFIIFHYLVMYVEYFYGQRKCAAKDML